jgi:hypothetical protein
MQRVEIKGRIFRPFCFGLFVMMMAVGKLSASPTLVIELQSVNYSEPTSIWSLSGKWNDVVDKGDFAVSRARLNLGFSEGPWTLQIVNRRDNYYEFDNATVQFISLAENQQSLTSGEQYRLFIKQHFSASKGLRFGYQFEPYEKLSLKTWFILLEPTDLRSGKLNAIDKQSVEWAMPLMSIYPGGRNQIINGCYRLAIWRESSQLMMLGEVYRRQIVVPRSSVATVT